MKIVILTMCALVGVATASAQEYDINRDKVLYTVGYGHLDTQWQWDVRHTINTCLKNTLEENFYLFEKYPDYVYNFTGSRRYKMMKEYYPQHYKKLKEYIAAGRWYISGSSVDEGEVNISSPEALMRQVLYGNRYFKQEFGKESYDYMLPDCFGFVATLPSVLSHAGLLGFSTQKLTWRLAGSLPFNVGVWNGLDGEGIIAALSASDYTGYCEKRLDTNDYWDGRINDNINKYDFSFDYRYYGVGDQGGAVRENDVRNLLGSLNNDDSKFKVVVASSDQMYKDVTPEIRAKMPSFTGDLLLVEHSAGSMTSQSYMKWLNRKTENLAQAAEAASVMAYQTTGVQYPYRKYNDSWELVLGNQMHDILPGTSTPWVYELAWNDAFIAANGFENGLKGALSQVSSQLDTRVKGKAVVVYNPVATKRNDVVEAEIDFGKRVDNVEVFAPNGKQILSQIASKNGNRVKVLFIADVPSVGFAVYDVRESSAKPQTSSLKVASNSLENDYYAIRIASNGDIESIYDKKLKRELLERPAGLEFSEETPEYWPAWNMDWADRSKTPIDRMDRNANLRVVEYGPVRVTIEVEREGQSSMICQRISLSAAEAGKRVEIANTLDWQSREMSLKAAFPFTISNKEATYNLGVGTIKRDNNREDKFEVPSKGWINLTDASGKYGVSILEDCKYASDKPSDNTLRLTLMYSPGVKHEFRYQSTQDWGVHNFKYGIYSHAGDWTKSETPWQAEFLNKPLVAFVAPSHPGSLGKEYSQLSISDKNVGSMAMKMAEDGDYVIVRVNEFAGKNRDAVKLTFASNILDAYEVNGQEVKIGEAKFAGNTLITNVGYNGIKSYAVKLAKSEHISAQKQFNLPYNQDLFTTDSNRDDADKLPGLYSYPAELVDDVVVSEGVVFNMGSRQDEQKNIVACNGETIDIPTGNYNKIYILASSEDANTGEFVVGNQKTNLKIGRWTGKIGQHYVQLFESDQTKVKELRTPYLNSDNIAWFSSHRHYGYPSGNQTYEYCYMYCYELNIPQGAKTITLPNNNKIKIFALTAVEKQADDIEFSQPIFESFETAKKVNVRN